MSWELSLMKFITVRLKKKKKTSLLSILIDLAQAFATVNHVILLQKLYHYGIRGTIHDWFKVICPAVQNSSCKFHYFVSPSLPVQWWVPQGSVLGPILFLWYINDISQILTNFKTIVVADDSAPYITGGKVTDVIHAARWPTCMMVLKQDINDKFK